MWNGTVKKFRMSEYKKKKKNHVSREKYRKELIEI